VQVAVAIVSVVVMLTLEEVLELAVGAGGGGGSATRRPHTGGQQKERGMKKLYEDAGIRRYCKNVMKTWHERLYVFIGLNKMCSDAVTTKRLPCVRIWYTF
jgi:hypothetical protein